MRSAPAKKFAKRSQRQSNTLPRPTSVSERSGSKKGKGQLATLVIAQERALPVSLLRAREAVMVHMRPILRELGYTEQQWRVLRSLSRLEPIDKTALAVRATLLMPSLLRILKDLQQMDLVRLVPSPGNPRLVRIALSKKGAAVEDAGSRALAAMGAKLRERIGADIVDDLLGLLQVVEKRLM